MHFNSLTECKIGFDDFDFGMVDMRFGLVCSKAGDGDSFSWRSAGDDFGYTISRIGTGRIKGYKEEQGSVWLLQSFGKQGEETTYVIDSPDLTLHELDRTPLSPRKVYEVSLACDDLLNNMTELTRMSGVGFVGLGGQLETILIDPTQN